MIYDSYRHTKKPYLSEAKIDWSHPLAKNLKGLFFCNGPYVFDIVNQNYAQITGSAYKVIDRLGQSIDLDAAQSSTYAEYSLADSAPYQMGTGNFSVGIIHRVDTTGSDQVIFGVGAGGTGGKRYFVRINSTSNVLDLEVDDNSTRTVALGPSVSTGVWYNHFISVVRSGNASFYTNGAFSTSASVAGTSGSLDDATYGADLYVGAHTTSGHVFYDEGAVALVALWDTDQNAAIPKLFYDQPLGLLVPRKIYFPVTAAGGITGTVAQTLADTTSAAAGGIYATATVEQSLANVASTASGGIYATSTANITLEDITSNTAGGIYGSGSLAKTFNDTTSTASGGIYALGTVSETLDDITPNISGTITVSGSINVTLDDITSDITGFNQDITGTVNITLDDVISSSNGFVGIQELPFGSMELLGVGY